MQIKEITKSAHGPRRLDKRSKTRVFVWPSESILQNLEHRRERPYKDWRPFALRAAAAMGLTKASIGWSQKAGCKCGCSPGFIVKGDYRPGFDIHVTLEA